jgi:hypothetical protein
MYSCIPEDKRGLFFFRFIIIVWPSFYVQIDVLQFVSRFRFYAKLSDFYVKLNVSNFVRNKFVLVLVLIDLIRFEFTQIVLDQFVLILINLNCIRSICT